MQQAVSMKLAGMISKGQLKRLIRAAKKALPPRRRPSASQQVGILVNQKGLHIEL